MQVKNTDFQIESQKGLALLRILIEVHRWEAMNKEVFGTISARELYFSMLDELLKEKATYETSLKSHKGSTTTKATRKRIQSFESFDLAIIMDSTTDGRSKKLIPTKKFINLVGEHMSILEKLHQEII